MYNTKPVLYPFGYGLSYSEFKYGKMKTEVNADGDIIVTVPVKNISNRDGVEVVKVYATFPESKVQHPIKKLVAFTRCPVKAKQSAIAKLTVRRSDLEYWDEVNHKWTFEPGVRLTF